MWSAILSALPAIIKLIILIIERLKDKPDEERRQILAAFDAAVEKSKIGDLRDLSIWFSKRL